MSGFNFKYFVFSDVPSSPSKPEVSDITKDSAVLTWNAPDKDGGSPVTNYVIEMKPSGTYKWLPVAPEEDITGNSFKVKDLIEGTEYEFRVAAKNKAGISQPSAASQPIIAREPIGKLVMWICPFLKSY